MRQMTVLLYREQSKAEDEYIGCVGSYGSEWRSAPEMFERLNVVDEETANELAEVLSEMVSCVDYSVAKSAGVIDRAQRLLARIEFQK